MTDYSNQINKPVETSIAYGQTKEQANVQVQEGRQEGQRKVEPTQFKVRHPFIK